MFLCRSARLTLFPLARKSPAGFCRNVVPRRPMSSGAPGGSGENFVYFALCGVSLTAGLAYAYRTVTEDRTRYNDRVTELQARPKDEWQPKPWPAKGGVDAESEAEEAEGDEETPAEEAVAVEAPLEAADGSALVEAGPALVEAEPVSVATVDEPSGADLEAALAEAMEETRVEGAPASAESDALTPPMLRAIKTVSEVEAAEHVGIPVSCVGEAAEMLEDVAGEIMEVEAEGPKPNQLGTATGPDANHKDLMETQAVMGIVSERDSVVLADDTPTASTEADKEKSVVVQLVPEAKEVSTESAAEMSLVEETASAAVMEEESGVEEPVSSEEPAADTTAEGSEVKVAKEAVDTTEAKESTAATVEDPEVFISNVEPASTSKEGPAPDSTAEGSEVSVDYEMVDTSEAKESIVIVTEEPVVFTYKVEPVSASKEEPAPDSSAEGPVATLEEEAGDATEAKDSAATVVEELETFTSTVEALSSEEEEPAPDSTAEGPASLEEEPAEAPTESITLKEVKTETLESSIHPPERIPEVKTAATGPDNLTEETLSSKDEFSQVVEADISPDVEVQSSLEANPIMEAAEMKDDRPAVPAEMCPIVETSEPVLSTTVLAEEVTLKATEKAPAQLMGTESQEPKRTPAKEYIVVVLEGALKEPKEPKVLAIAPMTASVPSSKEGLLPPALEVKDP